MPQQAKTKDGLVALPELAAIPGSGRRLQVAEIGPQQGIPEGHRIERLASLRRGGLLDSCRGPGGGYRLARPPGGDPAGRVGALP